MRRRLLRSMVGVTGLAVVVFLLPLAAAAARVYRSREVTRLAREATRATTAFPDGTHAIALPRTSPDVRLALYDTRARRIAGVGPDIGSTEVRGALRGRVTDDHDGATLAVAVPVPEDEATVGAARASTPWARVEHETWRAWALLVALGLAAVAIAATVSWRVATALVAPVTAVAGLGLRLGDGDFGARIEPSGMPEIDQAIEALNRTAQRLGELVARERAFTADVSHQLNTPLTSLRLVLEGAQLNPGADDGDAINAANLEVDRLQATVATLLAVARDASGAAEARTDAAAVCREVVSQQADRAARLGRKIDVVEQPDTPAAAMPPEVLRQILSVLVDNAFVHGRGRVQVAIRPAGRGVIVEVADEGGGVATDPGELFQRRSPSASGHGIGLALARSLAHAHEARLELTRAGPHPVFSLAVPGARPPG